MVVQEVVVGARKRERVAIRQCQSLRTRHREPFRVVPVEARPIRHLVVIRIDRHRRVISHLRVKRQIGIEPGAAQRPGGDLVLRLEAEDLRRLPARRDLSSRSA